MQRAELRVSGGLTGGDTQCKQSCYEGETDRPDCGESGSEESVDFLIFVLDGEVLSIPAAGTVQGRPS